MSFQTCMTFSSTTHKDILNCLVMQWKTLRSRVVLNPTDFQCISKNSWNILKNILFCCCTKKRKTFRFGTTWGWINDNRRDGKCLTCCTGQCQAAIYAGREGELSWSLHTPLDPTSTGNHSIPAKETSFRKMYLFIQITTQTQKFHCSYLSEPTVCGHDLLSLILKYKHKYITNINLIKCATCGSSSLFQLPTTLMSWARDTWIAMVTCWLLLTAGRISLLYRSGESK